MRTKVEKTCSSSSDLPLVALATTATAITTQPKLASQEDVNEETIKAAAAALELDPLLEPLKKTTGFRIVEFTDSESSGDEARKRSGTEEEEEQEDEEEKEDVGDEGPTVKYEIAISGSDSSFIGKKKLRDGSEAYCHDNQLGCDFSLETSDGKCVMEMQASPGYSGLAQMDVVRGDESLGKIVQDYDVCAACNPQYTIFKADGEVLLHIPVLDSGCFCGVFGVKKFLIVSGNKDRAIGDISNESPSSKRTGIGTTKTLLKHEQLANFVVTFPEKLNVYSKLMLIAATFTVNFHDTVFRFRRNRPLQDTE